MSAPDRFPYSDTLSSIIADLHAAVSLAESAALKTSADLGLNEWRVLAALADGAETAAQVSASTGIDKGWVSRSIAALIETGRVSRVASPRDGRSKSLALTEAGITAHNDAARALRDLQNRLLDAFSADDHQAFVRLADRLRREGKIITENP